MKTSTVEPSNPMTAAPKYSNIVKGQERFLKTAFMNMIEILNDKMNKSPKEVYENSARKMNKTDTHVLQKW